MIVKLCKILVSPGCSSCVWWLDIQLVSVLGVTPCHAATHFIHVLSETKLLDTINNIATKYLQCICIVSWLSWWHSTLLLQHHHCQCWISSVKHVSSFPKFFRNIFTTNERWQLKCVFNFWEIPGWHSQKFEANNFNFDCSNSALVGQTHPSYDGSILVKPPPPPPPPPDSFISRVVPPSWRWVSGHTATISTAASPPLHDCNYQIFFKSSAGGQPGKNSLELCCRQIANLVQFYPEICKLLHCLSEQVWAEESWPSWKVWVKNVLKSVRLRPVSRQQPPVNK